MKYIIQLSAIARQDIEAVLSETLRQFGPQQLDRYTDLIRLAIADLSENPLGFRSQARPELHAAARVIHIGRRGRRARHLLLYRVVENVVRIDRCLHDAIDIQRHSPES